MREKVQWTLASTEEVLSQTIGLGGVAAALAGTDPEFSGVLREVLATALEPLGEQVSADVRARRLTPHADPDIVLNLLLGSYLAEVVRYGAPRPDWMERTTNLLATALGAEGR